MQEIRKQVHRLLAETVRAENKARRRGVPEDWHRLRVASRRLRGALAAHAGFFDSAEHTRLARKAKRITRLPGKLRDLDVARELLGVLRQQCPDEAGARVAKELRRTLKRERTRQVKRIQRKLRRDRPAAVLSVRVRAAMRAREWTASVVARPHARVLLPLKRTILQRQSAIRTHRDAEALHRLRVAVKRYRGALAALLAGMGDDSNSARSSLIALQKLQDVLGAHHDWSQLAARIVAEVPASAGRRSLLKHVRREQRAAYVRYRVLSARLNALLAADARLLSSR